MTVTAILNQKGEQSVATIAPDALLSDCVKELAERKIGALIILDDNGVLEGIISERDVVRVLAEQGMAALAKSVSATMTRDVQTCALDDRTETVLRQMTEGRFRHLPVMKDGRMHAVISIGDVVKYRISEMEMQKTALEDMIKGF